MPTYEDVPAATIIVGDVIRYEGRNTFGAVTAIRASGKNALFDIKGTYTRELPLTKIITKEIPDPPVKDKPAIVYKAKPATVAAKDQVKAKVPVKVSKG